jgi:Tol biopolymer transport system component
MMIRRTVVSLAAMATLGCTPGTGDAPLTPPTPKRTTLVPGPGVQGFLFSKDGRLTFSRLIGGRMAVYVSDADGGNAKRVSFGVWDIAPNWSPDGKWIAFMRDAGGQSDVFIVPSDSGAERTVATTSASEVANDWLPDGSGFLFTRRTNRGDESWVYRFADGSSARQIEADGSVSAYPSLDGKWLAYTLTKNGTSTIWLWDRAKKTARQLTTEGFEQLTPRGFSPDSRSLLYYSRRTGTSDIWRVDIATGERRQVTQDIADDVNRGHHFLP